MAERQPESTKSGKVINQSINFIRQEGRRNAEAKFTAIWAPLKLNSLR